jgi:hypothetical protein
MEKRNNTGLGLIKTTIERAQNEKSLFNSALKKLVNSSEEELDNFLKGKIDIRIKDGILRLISDNQTISLKSLTGKRLIYQAEKIFKSYIDPDFVNWGLNKFGIATPETLIKVDEVVSNGKFMDVFRALPGTWNQKWLSQNQVIEFCETFSSWLKQGGDATMFLCKIDENKLIDENKPQDNLFVVYVRVRSDGLDVRVFRLERDYVWRGGARHRVVSPQLIPLAE